MPASHALNFTVAIGISLVGGLLNMAAAQVPESRSAPRVADPAPSTLVSPQETAATVAQSPSQPVSPAGAGADGPAPVVSASPGGVTQLPPAASPATSSSSQAATASTRSYTAGISALLLDGAQAGWLTSVEGGGIAAEVITERGSEGAAPKKHLGQPKYESISVQVDWAAKPLLEWVAASWKGSSQRRSGSVLSMDHDYKARAARDFSNAAITGTTFPVLGADSRAPALLTVKLSPEVIRPGAASGAREAPPSRQSSLSWSGDFRLELAGLDASRVIRIDSFTVGKPAIEHAVGERREYEKESGPTEFPILRITLAESASQTWVQWSDDFIAKGNNGDGQERSGAIVFLDRSLRNELGRVSLLNCGIAGLRPNPQVSSSDRISTVTAELYCEQMALVTGAAVGK